MDTNPTKNPDPKAQDVPDLPLPPDEATDVKGGGIRVDPAAPKLYDVLCKGTHLPEVTLE